MINKLKIQKSNLKAKNSFTLLEMLVVIGIIAVLVGFGAVSYSTSQKKARDTRRKLDMEAIKNAMEQYYSLCNSVYPAAISGKVPNSILTQAPPTCSTVTTILTVSPTDPKTGDSYDYDDTATPPSICATDGATNLMESESTVYCVYLQ